MKASITTRIGVAIGALIVALMVSMILSFQARHHQTESRRWVMHTYEVLNALERIHSVMKDAEIGQQGFLLTADDDYLEPHNRASAKIDGLIDQLQKLMGDNPTQQLRLGKLSTITDALLDEQKRIIAVRKSRGLNASADLVDYTKSEEKMNEIHEIVEQMIEQENMLLKERSASLDQNTATAFAYSTCFNISSMLCLLAAGWLLVRFVMAREKAEAELAIQYAVSRILHDAPNLPEATKAIEQLIAESGEWTIAVTWLVDQKNNILRCLNEWHQSAVAESEFVKETSTLIFEKGQGLPGKVWDTEKAQFILDVTKDPGFLRASQAEKIGLRSAFAFPVMFGGKVLAVKVFFSKDEREINNNYLDMMTAIGNQLGQFIVAKSIEEETERQKKFLQLILDTVSDGILVCDAEGKFILTNPTARELVGSAPDDPANWSEHFGCFLGPDGPVFPSEELPLVRAMRGENCDDVEMFVRNEEIPNGNWISVSGRPMRAEGSSDVTGGVIFFRDVNDRKEAETRVSEFYSTVSHELRTPLTSIRGSLGLIEGGLAGALPEKTLKLIKIARAESDRLIRLINDILDLRKIEAGMLELKKTNVETRHLVEKTVDNIRGMAQERGVELVSKLNTGGQTLCDEDRLTQVLTNLISNAIKFSESGDSVVVSLDPGEKNSFKFSVTDTGPGIPQEHMHKLFGKFQQLDQSDARKKEGTGLGLAITQAIVSEHGGKIGVDSEVGKGSTFWFEIPATFAPVSVSTTEKKLPGKHVHPALVIEDDENIAELLSMHLMQDGFEVVHAKTLEEARHFLTEYEPIVILLDLNLPDGNGLDLLAELSANNGQKKIPVVIVTGNEKKEGEDLLHPALIDWIAKPFDEERLHKALDVARQQIGIARVLLVEDDPSTREILKHQLEALGVKCVEAKSGAEAIRNFDESNPDLIVLDLMIPPPDGFAVVEKLKNHPAGLKPLVVYSALDLSEAEKEKLQLGITAHLTKSTATADQLSQTIRDFLDGLMLRKPKDEDGA